VRRVRIVLSWTMLVAGVIGFAVTFPAWLLGWVDDRAMLGVTLALSWAALWYEAFNAVQIAHKEG
jgi:hypothetical protein